MRSITASNDSTRKKAINTKGRLTLSRKDWRSPNHHPLRSYTSWLLFGPQPVSRTGLHFATPQTFEPRNYRIQNFERHRGTKLTEEHCHFRNLPPPIPWEAGAVTLAVKVLGREADYLPPYTTEVKNTWSYIPPPPKVIHGVVFNNAQVQLHLLPLPENLHYTGWGFRFFMKIEHCFCFMD
jgi:hypothetical protein